LEKTIYKKTTLEIINAKKKTMLEKVAWMMTTSKKAMLKKTTIQKKEVQKMETMMAYLKIQRSVHEKIT
jgi:hypothetical protein